MYKKKRRKKKIEAVGLHVGIVNHIGSSTVCQYLMAIYKRGLEHEMPRLKMLFLFTSGISGYPVPDMYVYPNDSLIICLHLDVRTRAC